MKRVRRRLELIKTANTSPKYQTGVDTAKLLRKRIADDSAYGLTAKTIGFTCPVCGKKMMHVEKSIYIPDYLIIKCDNCWTVTDPMPTRYELRKAYNERNWSANSNPALIKKSRGEYDPDGLTNLLAGIAQSFVVDYARWQKRADFWDGELKAVLEELDNYKESKKRTSRASWASHRAYNKSIEKIDICACSLDDDLGRALDHLDEVEAEALRSPFIRGIFEDPQIFVELMRKAYRE